MLIPLTDEIIILHMDNGGSLTTPSKVYGKGYDSVGYVCDTIEKIDDVRKRFGSLFLDPAGVVWARVNAVAYQRVNGYRLS